MRSVRAIVLVSVGFGCLWLASHVFFSPSPYDDNKRPVAAEQTPLEPPTVRPPEGLLHATPQAKFRDNLQNDMKYVTTWPSAGSTNDFLSILSLIYIAINTDRVPILPPFVASHHLAAGAGTLPFGTIYDLPRLRKTLGVPILEWRDVKILDVDAEEMPVEEIGCWSVHMGLRALGGNPVRPPAEALLGLDISYWPIRSDSSVGHDPHPQTANLLALSALSDERYRNATLARKWRDPEPCTDSGALIEPDDHLQCFDYLYFSGTYDQDQFEHFSGFSPTWRWVGQFVHFNPTLMSLARGMLHRTLGISESSNTPPFIAVHVRRGDFSGWCDDKPRDECFAPLSDYAKKASEIREALASRGTHVRYIVVSGDEQDAAWWAQVTELGFLWVDHAKEDTVGRHGKWYPTIIDAVIQSLAVGLVGTDRSTFSQVSKRRMESWNAEHEFRNVRWGSLGLND